MHEVGVTTGYVEMEYDSANVYGATLGELCHLTFPIQGIAKRCVGVNVAALGGDNYDLSYRESNDD